jgi:serine phosphatase RsbU (regulator of sigma subunit)
MNAVFANGMLHEASTIESSCGRILSRLNSGLCPRMEKDMFTALGLAVLDQNAKTLQWASAAQPCPMIKRNGQVFEFKHEGGLPLGIIPTVEYVDSTLEMQAGDIVVFYTDGIIEATNEMGQMYGFERLKQSLTYMDSAMDAERITEAILRHIYDFAGFAQQYDDMTVVVLKKV